MQRVVRCLGDFSLEGWVNKGADVSFVTALAVVKAATVEVACRENELAELTNGRNCLEPDGNLDWPGRLECPRKGGVRWGYVVVMTPQLPPITVVALQRSSTATLYRNATSERTDSSFAGLRATSHAFYGLDFPRLNSGDSLAGWKSWTRF